MKKIIFSVLAIASVLFTGCNVKEFAPAVPVQDGLVRVSASIDATKIGVGAQAGKYAWEAGDVIGVWTGAAFTPFTIENASVGKTAGTFAGTLPEGGAINEASYAVYPYCEEDVLDGTNYTSKYEGDNWQFKSLVPLAAKPTATVDGSTVASFKFSHLTALALLKLKNIPVDAKSVFFESTKQLFFISGTADLSAEYPKFAVEETADYCFMDIPEHSKPIDMTIFVPLNMGEFADPKFRFTLFSCTTGDDFDWGAEMEKATYNHYGFLSTGGFINRGDLYVLPEVNFGGNEPEKVQVTIDGDMAEWANVTTGIEDANGPYYAFKATYDDEYVYVYSKRDFRNTYWGGNGYFYYYFDLDNNPETGIEHSGIAGVESFVFLYPFGGTNDAPAINVTPKGERNLNGTQAAYTLHENGCAGVIGDQFVEVEISLPRADMNVKAGDTVRMYSWCNKDGGNLKSQYITLTF